MASLSKNAASSAQAHVETASAAASDALAQLTSVANDLADETARRARQAEAFAREHVGASLGVAVAIGLVAGLLLRRR